MGSSWGRPASRARKATDVGGVSPCLGNLAAVPPGTCNRNHLGLLGGTRRPATAPPRNSSSLLSRSCPTREGLSFVEMQETTESDRAPMAVTWPSDVRLSTSSRPRLGSAHLRFASFAVPQDGGLSAAGRWPWGLVPSLKIATRVSPTLRESTTVRSPHSEAVIPYAETRGEVGERGTRVARVIRGR